MLKRCIMIFPKFKNEHVVDAIRKKYDPLAEHVRPHITLVFPFESDIETDKLENHIETMVSGIRPFELTLSGITPSISPVGNCLFLNIKEGAMEIIELHKRLYKGILNEFHPEWLKNVEFLPHMTVGCISDLDDFKKAVEETKNIAEGFETTAQSIGVEIIDENEDSIIELNILLKA